MLLSLVDNDELVFYRQGMRADNRRRLLQIQKLKILRRFLVDHSKEFAELKFNHILGEFVLQTTQQQLQLFFSRIVSVSVHFFSPVAEQKQTAKSARGNGKRNPEMMERKMDPGMAKVCKNM